MLRKLAFLVSLLSILTFTFTSTSFAQVSNPACAHTLFLSSGEIRSNMRTLQNVSASVASQVNLRSARETATDFCNALAGESSAGLVPGSFKAAMSLNPSGTIHVDDSGKPVQAKDYIQITGPVCNMRGEIIANNATEFWSTSHRAKMNIDEKGADRGNYAAWTGSTALGAYSSSSCGGRPTCNCYNWTSTKDTSHGGNTGRGCAKDGRWSVGAWRDASADSTGCSLSNGVHNSPCGSFQKIYCLGTALAAPTNVQASDGTSTTSVLVTWNAVNTATSYQIFRSTLATANGPQIGTSTTTNFSDTIAQPGVTYFYRVKTVRASAISAFSAADSGFRQIITACNNGVDDDGDGLIDLADPGCSGPTDPTETNPTGPACDNGVDDDGDSLIDFPRDPGCSGPTDTTETNPNGPDCDNGVDDDGDSLIDFPRDPGCSSVTDTTETDPNGPDCDNGVDDDGDGLIDFPRDPGCSGPTDNTETNPNGPECDNGVDDDGDSLIDFPRDPGCSSVTDNSESGAAACDNDLDDDGDGLIDLADPGCSGPTDTTETNPNGPACDNGVDDDGDSLIDFPRDPGCSSVTDTTETNPNGPACDNGVDDDGDSLIDFPRDPGCSSVTDTTETNPNGPACDNGRDDDGDSLIDFPRDPGCSSVTDTTETNPNGPACDNGLDDDGDSLIDFPRDPGCSSVTDTTETNPNGPACDNGVDDDSDSLIDFPRDPGCSSVTDTSELGTAACDNNLDDDGDGLKDFRPGNATADPGCSSVTDTSELSTVACDNGVDDDGDSLIDFRPGSATADPGCSSVTDTSELGTVACDNNLDDDGDGLKDFRPGNATADPGCSSVTDTSELGTAACDNNLDDDGDGLKDFRPGNATADPGCSSVTDTSELSTIACDNGVDDDGDTLIDFRPGSATADPGCSSVTDTTETNANGPDCDNGLDDDSDGLIDVAQDPGCSGPTDPTEEEPLDPLPAPQNVQASDGTDPAAVIVTWNASAGATQYQVFRSEVESENGQLIATVSTTSRRDTSASPGIVYFYRIKAINPVNQSAVSDSDSGFRLEPSRLSSPLFTKFNTFLAQSNILELSATGNKGFVKNGSVDNRVRLTIYNLFGRVILTMPVSISAGRQKDLNVNSLVQSACDSQPFLCDEFFDLDSNGTVDTFGLVKLEFPDNDSNLALLGRMTNYRADAGGQFSFAYAKDLRNAVRGTTYSVSNTFDPQAMGFLVPNWAEIINLDEEEAHSFTYRLYTQNGTKVIERRITVPALGERDVQAGHEIFNADGQVLESVFLVEVIPESNDFDYFLSVTRFSANAPRGVEPRSFNYAFSLDGRPGNSSALYSAITNEDRDADCALVQNWLEVSNVREKSVRVTVKFKETNIADAGLAASLPVTVTNKATQTITLNPKSQFHFNASAMLAKGTIGVAEISSNEPGAVISQSLVYLNNCDRNGVQTAYVTPARQRSSESSLTGTLNTFLNMSNDVRLSATSSSGASLVFNSKLFGGGTSTGILKLQGFQATSLIAESTFAQGTPNLDTGTIGTINLDAGANKKGSFVGDVLRVKRANVAGRSRIDFILPTSIR